MLHSCPDAMRNQSSSASQRLRGGIFPKSPILAIMAILAISSLSPYWPSLCRADKVEPGQFQQGEAAGIFFTRGLKQNHNLASSFLLNHTSP